MIKISNPSLVAALTLTAYLTRVSNRRPNPPPSQIGTSAPKDFLTSARFLPNLREWVLLVCQAAHILLTAQFPPRSRSLLCRNPAVLNPRYFTWNAFTGSTLALAIAAASIRIAAFRSLGRNFTFELARPAKLVTTGLYAHVQHPSYPTDVAVTVCNFALLVNPDGWLGSLLPEELRLLWVRYKWATYVALTVATGTIFTTRVRQEEDMLRREYGKEWEEWHAKTARFIPGIF